MPPILLLIRETSCVCSNHPLFQRTDVQKMWRTTNFMFGGRFGVSQMYAEDSLCSTLANFFINKSTPANTVGTKVLYNPSVEVVGGIFVKFKYR